MFAIRLIAAAFFLTCVLTDATAQSRTQLKVLDEVAEATVAAQRCPNLVLDEPTAAQRLRSASIDIRRAPFDTLWAGRMIAGRHLFDRNLTTCAQAFEATTLLNVRR